jgi:glycosyltransferase involved in cell wall biosynthesis
VRPRPGARGVADDATATPVVGILTDISFDEWLATIDVSLEAFAREMIGTWWFNYVQALERRGIRTVLFCTSGAVRRTTRLVHEPTGAVISVLPQSRFHGLTRGRMNRLDAQLAGRRPALRRALRGALRAAALYTSVPLRALRRALREERCSVLLIEQYETPRFDVAVLLGRALGVPAFGTFTSVPAPERWWLRLLRRPALRLSAGLAVCAGSEVARVERRYRLAPGKIRRIHYPVDTSFWRPLDRRAARSALGLPAEAGVVVYHGAIDIWIKGLDLLLEAWRQVANRLPERELRLVLIGTGPDAAALREELASRPVPGLEWLDRWVHDRALLRTWLAAADAYAFPSRVDAFGISVLEAMACGLPVAAAAAPAIPDILPEGEASGGIVIPTDDAGALADALERLLTGPALAKRMGVAARRRVEEAFSMDLVGKQLATFLFDGAR